MKRFTLLLRFILVLITFLLPQPINSAPVYFLDQARVLWVTHNTATIQWNETVKATIYVERYSELGERYLIATIEAELGWQLVPIPFSYPADRAFIPQNDDFYTLTGWAGPIFLGTAGPYRLQSTLWLPIIGNRGDS